MDEYTEEVFEQQYKKVYESVIKDGAFKKNRAVIFLGGQPGSGKSKFYTDDANFDHYIVIDGDKYRQHHPFYNSISHHDIDNLAERTQSFVNRCIERLIDDLSKEGYNLLIEGTLRDPDVPIRTATSLKERGYRTDLYVITCSATEAWRSTINRAKLMSESGEAPRIVPIDKFDRIVHGLPNSLGKIEASKVMDSISIMGRNYEKYYSSHDHHASQTITDTIDNILNIHEWDQNFSQTAEEFDKLKISILHNNIGNAPHLHHSKGR